MERHLRVCEASSNLFGGFRFMFDIRTIESEEDIIQTFKLRLLNIFKNHNLVYLQNEVNKRNFHIHSHTFEDILLLDTEIVYICDHC